MTCTVLAYRDKGWYDNLRTEKRLWEHTCKPYNTKFYFLEDSIELPKENLIVLDQKGSISLTEFIHPEEAVYIFGRSCQTLIGNFDAQEVRIDTPEDISFFGPCAAAIVLFHRWLQWQ